MARVTKRHSHRRALLILDALGVRTNKTIQCALKVGMRPKTLANRVMRYHRAGFQPRPGAIWRGDEAIRKDIETLKRRREHIQRIHRRAFVILDTFQLRRSKTIQVALRKGFPPKVLAKSAMLYHRAGLKPRASYIVRGKGEVKENIRMLLFRKKILKGKER